MSDVTDWIGAISGAVGAVGTAGALLVGAVTLRRQINDTHRAQAMAVTLSVTYPNPPMVNGRMQHVTFELRNDSSLPIYQIFFGYQFPSALEESFFQTVLPAHEKITRQMPNVSGYKVARFYDAARQGWTRYVNGDLSPRYEFPKTTWPAENAHESIPE
jgi:hypothetical protein